MPKNTEPKAETMTYPEGSIVGHLTMVKDIGELNTKGQVMKQRKYEADFGSIAMNGTLYGKTSGTEYEIVLIPKKVVVPAKN